MVRLNASLLIRLAPTEGPGEERGESPLTITLVPTGLDWGFVCVFHRLRPGLMLSRWEVHDAPLHASGSGIGLDWIDDRPGWSCPVEIWRLGIPRVGRGDA